MQIKQAWTKLADGSTPAIRAAQQWKPGQARPKVDLRVNGVTHSCLVYKACGFAMDRYILHSKKDGTLYVITATSDGDDMRLYPLDMQVIASEATQLLVAKCSSRVVERILRAAYARHSG